MICLTGDDDDLVLAELRDEELVVRVQLKSGVFETRLHPPPSSMPLNAAQRRFNDDRWHKLVVSREAREVTLPSCQSVCQSVCFLFCRLYCSFYLSVTSLTVIFD